jgi:hypothetical protein
MYKTYKCVDCGHINVFKSYRIDGIRCMKCKGDLTYIGDCSVEKSRDYSIKIGCDTSEIDTALKKVNSLNDRLMQSEIYLNKLNLESDMNLFRVSNGYIGESYVRVLVVAKDKARALELAKEKFKSESGYYGERYYSNLEAELLGNTEKELICEIEE